MKVGRWMALFLAVFALVAGGGLLLERETSKGLRSELSWLRDENRQRAQLQEENRRLKAEQIPAQQLDRLRADHAALVRLRNEIETMKARAAREP